MVLWRVSADMARYWATSTVSFIVNVPFVKVHLFFSSSPSISSRPPALNQVIIISSCCSLSSYYFSPHSSRLLRQHPHLFPLRPPIILSSVSLSSFIILFLYFLPQSESPQYAQCCITAFPLTARWRTRTPKVNLFFIHYNVEWLPRVGFDPRVRAIEGYLKYIHRSQHTIGNFLLWTLLEMEI
jgi:hypothetical protein